MVVRPINSRLTGTLILLAVLNGCGRENPVHEISATDSGVEVRDHSSGSEELYWASWRGPHGNGVAPDQTLPTAWDNSSGVLWRSDVPGRGHSAPVVIGDSVYVATAIAEPETQQVLSYDRETGDSQWTTTVHEGGLPSERSVHRKSTHANATIASDGHHLYAVFLNSDSIIVTAINIDGKIVWRQEAGKFVSRFGYAPSPVLYKSLVIVAADNSGGGYLAALDGETGKVAWRISRGNIDSYSSATVANVGGRDQLLISGCDNVTSYDPATGEKLWATPTAYEASCGTVVTTDELIFASGGYPSKETVCLSATGERLWANKTKVYEPSMVVVADQLIGVTDGGIAHCWRTATGDVVWRKRLSGNFSASPLVCNGRVYVPNLSGDTFVFTSEDGAYRQISKNKLGDDCYASPAAADGKLFLRVGVGSGSTRQEQLVCIGE